MNITAMPFFKDGKRLMFRGAENFGAGSYDPKRGMHKFALSGKSIIPVTVNTIIQETGKKPIDGYEIKYNAMVAEIFEN